MGMAVEAVPKPLYDPPDRILLLGDGPLAEQVRERLANATKVIRPAALRTTLAPGDCVIAVGDDHEENLRAALTTAEVQPSVPVIIRAFDPLLAEKVEREVGGLETVKGAFSVAHIAAPAFVARALLPEEEESLVTFRLGKDYLNVTRLRVHAGQAGLDGHTPAEVLKKHKCQVVAHRPKGGGWVPPGDAPLEAGDDVLVGGRIDDVLTLARVRSNIPVCRKLGPPARRSSRDLRRAPGRMLAIVPPRALAILLALLLVVTAATFIVPSNGLWGRFSLWVNTALGNAQDGPQLTTFQTVFASVALLAGGIALGLAISVMSAVILERHGRAGTERAVRRLRKHVIVVGMGDLGLRVCERLRDLRVPYLAIEPHVGADPERTARLRQRLGNPPVLTDDLEGAIASSCVRQASAVIACSRENIINVEACVRVRRESNVRTVARAFDTDEERVRKLGVDHVVSSARVAAGAFVDRAVFRHPVRSVCDDGYELLTLQWPKERPLSAERMQQWHDRGVRLLATANGNGTATPPAEPVVELFEHSGLLIGSPSAIEAIAAELDDTP
jgi:Trk K+ transport system NAD-binding subunit